MSNSNFKKNILNTRMITCIFTGFASGLPLYILIQLIPIWLRDEEVGLAEIGLLSLTTLPYTLKFLWAPFLDKYSITFFHRTIGLRRSWMILTQIILILLIGSLGFLNPSTHLFQLSILCLGIAIFSSTFDIAVDAYRRQILPDPELGLGNSIHVNAYRISSLIPGSLALILSTFMSWTIVFIVTSSFILVGIAMTLMVREPELNTIESNKKNSFLIDPFLEFFSRQGVMHGIAIILFMLLFKLGDSMATSLATPFYYDLGFSMEDIGVVAKNAALWPSIFGGIAGGIIMIKIGINKALWIFGLIQILSILGFAILARVGEGIILLGLVISFEYLGVGLGTAAFIAFIARTTSKQYAATQFALFTAMTAIPRTTISASSGFIVETIGWESFFYLCTLLALPGMILLLKVAPWGAKPKT